MSAMKRRGGATIGWVNATWPCATLAADPKGVVLNCMGEYALSPAEVISITPNGRIPFWTGGVRLRITGPIIPRR